MEDYKWLFYLIVGIIYFIIQSKKKKVQQPPSESKPFETNQPPKTSSKPVTFEDLLREIQQGKAPAPPKPQAKPVPKPISLSQPQRQSPKYEDYDDNIEPDGKVLEDVGYDYRNQDKIYETYENAKKNAFNQPSLEDTMHVEDTVMKYGKFKEFSKEATPSLGSIIAKDLKDKGNIRKAFILSEILNRR
jgi:DNA mismatch repair ATPase MutL